MTPASIAGLALNFAINTSFGLAGTKWGHARGGSLMAGAIGFGVIDLFLQLFTGGGDVPPSPAGISQAHLDASLDDLATRIEKDIFNMFESLYLEDVKAVIRQHDALWDQLKEEADEFTGQPDIDKVVWAAWQKSFDFFDNEAQPGVSAGLKAASFVTDQVDAAPNNLLRKYQTLPLYMLGMGAYLNACQFVMLREWQKICTGMDDPNSAYQIAYSQWNDTDMPAYRSTLKAWKARKDTWDVAEQGRVDAVNRQRVQFAQGGGGSGAFGPPGLGVGQKNWRNPPGGPTIVTFNDPSLDDVTFESPTPFAEAPPDPPSPPIGPPISPSKLTDMPYAQNIRKYVALAIDHAAPLLADMKQANADDATRKAKLVGHTVVEDQGGGWAQVHDTASGLRSKSIPRDVADVSVTIEQGIIRAGMARQGNPVAGIIVGDDLENFIKSISNWVQTLNNYAKPGDTVRIDPFATTT